MERLAKMFVFVLAVLFLSFQSSLLAQEYKNKDVNDKKSGSSQDNQENQFKKTAKDLTLRLSRNVNLSEDQSNKVSDILVDLQKDVADKGNKDNGEAVGSSNDSKDKLRDADVSANDKIEKIITDKEIPAYLKVKKEWWAKIKDKVYSPENFSRNEDRSGNKTTARSKDNRRGSDKTDVIGSNRSDNNNAGSEDKDKENPQFEQFAKDMSVDLMKKLDLSLEKAADVEDALIDYQKSIADAQKSRMDEDRSNTADNTGSVRSRNQRDRDNENVGSSRNRNNFSNEMQSAIRSADDKIVDVLNDNQKPKYEKVKKQWWKNVQSRISSSIRHSQGNNR
jgi:hypothetical protein